MFSFLRTVEVQVRFEFKWSVILYLFISRSKFYYFLIKILCFTDEEIEARGLGGLSDLFNDTRPKKQNRKQDPELANFWSSACYLTF